MQCIIILKGKTKGKKECPRARQQEKAGTILPIYSGGVVGACAVLAYIVGRESPIRLGTRVKRC